MSDCNVGRAANKVNRDIRYEGLVRRDGGWGAGLYLSPRAITNMLMTHDTVVPWQTVLIARIIIAYLAYLIAWIKKSTIKTIDCGMSYFHSINYSRWQHNAGVSMLP